MQWFDSIMTAIGAFGGMVGFGWLHERREQRRHDERMAEGERRHDRFMQSLKAISNAKNQTVIDRVKQLRREWEDWEL